MAGLTKEQRAARDAEKIEDAPEVRSPGAVEQLTAASNAAARSGQHAEHAKLEAALFALYTARGKLADVDLGGPTGAIKALL